MVRKGERPKVHNHHHRAQDAKIKPRDKNKEAQAYGLMNVI
jgi:hypothetical protein